MAMTASVYTAPICSYAVLEQYAVVYLCEEREQAEVQEAVDLLTEGSLQLIAGIVDAVEVAGEKSWGLRKK